MTTLLSATSLDAVVGIVSAPVAIVIGTVLTTSPVVPGATKNSSSPVVLATRSNTGIFWPKGEPATRPGPMAPVPLSSVKPTIPLVVKSGAYKKPPLSSITTSSGAMFCVLTGDPTSWNKAPVVVSIENPATLLLSAVYRKFPEELTSGKPGKSCVPVEITKGELAVWVRVPDEPTEKMKMSPLTGSVTNTNFPSMDGARNDGENGWAVVLTVKGEPTTSVKIPDPRLIEKTWMLLPSR